MERLRRAGFASVALAAILLVTLSISGTASSAQPLRTVSAKGHIEARLDDVVFFARDVTLKMTILGGWKSRPLASPDGEYEDLEAGTNLASQAWRDSWEVLIDTPFPFPDVTQSYITAFLRSRHWNHEQCRLRSQQTYRRGHFVGAYTIWDRCGGVSGSVFVELFATPEPHELAALQLRLVSGASPALVNKLLNGWTIQYGRSHARARPAVSLSPRGLKQPGP